MSDTTRPDDYRFDDRDFTWKNFAGFDDLYYRLLDVNPGKGTVDMLMKFEPDAECVPHRHVGATKTLVIEGEHHVRHINGDRPDDYQVRKAGTFSSNSGDELHLEKGGPEGAIILLMMSAVDGLVYDLLDDAFESERKIMLADFERGLARQREREAAA